ncbi:MAG: 50S ribosomal protein L13 [Patescibacteria group bacterium]|jgi:large subunit ribosomal protein L13
MKRSVHNINASGRVLGKLATEVAVLLMGKHKPEYEPHTNCGDIVVVTAVDQMKLDKKKMEQKIYYHHTLFPGGVKAKTAKNMPKDKMLRTAVYNMLPKNKLRAKLLRRLTIQ